MNNWQSRLLISIANLIYLCLIHSIFPTLLIHHLQLAILLGFLNLFGIEFSGFSNLFLLCFFYSKILLRLSESLIGFGGIDARHQLIVLGTDFQLFFAVFFNDPGLFLAKKLSYLFVKNHKFQFMVHQLTQVKLSI